VAMTESRSTINQLWAMGEVGVVIVFATFLIGIKPVIERFTSQDLTKDACWLFLLDDAEI